MIRTRGGLFKLITLVFILCCFCAEIFAATPEQVAEMVSKGQQYLYNQFVDNEDGSGYWPDYTNLAGTCAAVAALLETGKADDPDYHDMIVKGVEYIKKYIQQDGSIQDGHQMYETGLALVALSLFDADHSQGPEFEQVIKDAVDFLLIAQNLDETSNEYGGWYYSHPSRDGDLSNTQFAVMGLWYAYRYLGLQPVGTDWADALMVFLQGTQSFHDGGENEGAFSYYPHTTSFLSGTMTGAGIWCLAMIGEETNPMTQKAVDWFANNYRWDIVPGPDASGAYYYFVYGMAKGLTAALGTNGKVGENDWVQDLQDTMWENKQEDGGAYFWNYDGWLDPDAVMSTSWVLMSIAFADTNVEVRERILADPKLDNPVKGKVTLTVPLGVTITGAIRSAVADAKKGLTVGLPIGAVGFTLNLKKGTTCVMTIELPAGAMDPENPDSFVNPDGTLKDGLAWFKIENGEWKGHSTVPIEIDKAANVIRVLLTDGGPEDEDGKVNGKIVDPGAPGYGFAFDDPDPVVVDDDEVPAPQMIRLPESDTDSDSPIPGPLFVYTEPGIAVNGLERRPIGNAVKDLITGLPVGAIAFTLENLTGPTTVLTIQTVSSAFDPNNLESFVNPDGSIKDNLAWYKIVDSRWTPIESVPIDVDPDNNLIRVTLTDGGPEDMDGVVNGTIVDPGFTSESGLAANEGSSSTGPDINTKGSGSGGCFVNTVHGSSLSTVGLAASLLVLLSLLIGFRKKKQL